ncbi:natriuretic peptides A [Astyanax mexicanus]|uniref:Natriuretic peptides A n=1 Tax=Astyanax mexicanus TaxID=7994 RepID=A0A8B9K4F3_ASTMX|nr:natriuretic peptides A [Astyanax mexicanus]
MRLSYIPSACFLLVLSVQLLSAFPLQSGAFINEEMDVLKLLLDRLEEAIPAPMQSEAESTEMTKLDESPEESNPKPQVDARDYLSARDLKNVKLDSGSKRYSTCFGRRLDRIGSMSSLGCNTVGRNSPKRK